MPVTVFPLFLFHNFLPEEALQEADHLHGFRALARDAARERQVQQIPVARIDADFEYIKNRFIFRENGF
jgi:hypothetical protein